MLFGDIFLHAFSQKSQGFGRIYVSRVTAWGQEEKFFMLEVFCGGPILNSLRSELVKLLDSFQNGNQPPKNGGNPLAPFRP